MKRAYGSSYDDFPADGAVTHHVDTGREALAGGQFAAVGREDAQPFRADDAAVLHAE